jgi:hypothetical protein
MQSFPVCFILCIRGLILLHVLYASRDYSCVIGCVRGNMCDLSETCSMSYLGESKH